MKTITLSSENAKFLLEHIMAIVPTGGGSGSYNLFHEIAHQIPDIEIDYEMVGQLQIRAHNEYETYLKEHQK